MGTFVQVGDSYLSSERAIYGSFVQQTSIRDYINRVWTTEKPDFSPSDDYLDTAVGVVLYGKAADIAEIAQFWSIDEKERFTLILAKLFGICPKPGD